MRLGRSFASLVVLSLLQQGFSTEQGSDGPCALGAWSEWGRCSQSCGGGMVTRTRHVEPPSCTESKMQKEECPPVACPVDCEHTDWTEWDMGGCDGKCFPAGKKSRSITIMVHPDHGGKSCCLDINENCTKNEHNHTVCKEIKDCGEHPTDCVMAPWTQWSTCSHSCNTGTIHRERFIEKHHKCGGRPCLCDFLETNNCFEKECKVDCAVGDWTEWSACPASCDGAVQQRTRSITHRPSGGGADCPELIETKNCAMIKCPTHCVLSNWEEWSHCSGSCYGIQHRHRHVKVHMANHGKQCDALQEEQSCNQDCVIDCQVGAWSQWPACSTTCGGGSHTRTRPVIKALQNGGEACPELTESKDCNCKECPAADSELDDLVAGPGGDFHEPVEGEGDNNNDEELPEKLNEGGNFHEPVEGEEGGNNNDQELPETLENEGHPPGTEVEPVKEIAMCYSELYKKHCGGLTLQPLGTYKYGYQPDLGNADLNKKECESICDKFDMCHGFTYRPSDDGCFWKGGTLNPQLWNGKGAHDCLLKEPKVPCAQNEREESVANTQA